jgi:hypothetical protein
MLILCDHGTPAPLRSFLKDHTVKKPKDLGWDMLSGCDRVVAAVNAAKPSTYSEGDPRSITSHEHRNILSN